MNYFIFKLLVYFFGLSLSYIIVFNTFHYFWIIFLFLFIGVFERIYIRLDTFSEIYLIEKVNFLVFLVSFIVLFFFKKTEIESFFYFFILNMFFLPIWVYFCKKIFLQKLKLSFLLKNAIAIYDKNGKKNIESWFGNENVMGFRIVKRIKVSDINKNVLGEIDRYIDRYNVEKLVISLDNIKFSKLTYMINMLQPKISDIYIFPFKGFSFFNVGVLSSFNNKEVLFNIKNNLLNPFYKGVKNFLDYFLGIIIFILSSPLFLFIYVSMKFVLKETPFFIQERVGKDGKIFKLYKFKTMVDNASEVLERYLKDNPDAKKEWDKYKKLKNDPRVTKLGKFLRRTSLDELPQLFNVLKGEMAIIGPRPYLPDEINCMGKYFEYYKQVKPGITGLWQVSGRNELPFYERVVLDVWYIKNWSFELDFMILIKTVYIIFSRKGAY